MNSAKIRRLVLPAFFAAVIFFGTFLIKIPIPNGYIHFGDGFISIAAALLPLPYAMAAAAIGGLLSDLIAGFAAYAPFTAAVKLLIALVIGLILRKNVFVGRLLGQTTEKGGFFPLIIACLVGGIVNAGGYFITDCILYSFAAAISALPLNCLQSAFGIAVFFLFLPAFAKAFARFHSES